MNKNIIKKDIVERESDFSETIRELSSLEIKSIPIKNNLWKKCFELLQRIYENILKIIPCINTVSISLNTVGENQKQLEKNIDKLTSSQKMLSDDVTGFSFKTETTAINLQQTRLLVERVVDRIDNISQEFIDRHIIEPILKDFCSFNNTLRAMKQTDKTDMNYLIEQFNLILESYEIKLIEPQKGNSFNPNEHQPIKKLESYNPRDDKTINSTIRVGFKYYERIIQRAQVEVFTFKKLSKHEEVQNVSDKK